MVKKIKLTKTDRLERASEKLSSWIGTPQSILLHTLFFVGVFLLYLIGFNLNSILLILTTAVSLEAIYLAIFIQMTVNRNTKSLEEVEADIDEIQEDVEELEDDVEDISEDIDEIQADETNEQKRDREMDESLDNIESQLQTLLKEIDNLKTKNSPTQP